MNEKTQKEIFKFFAKNKIENFVGVPDSTLKHFISEGIKHEKILIAKTLIVSVLIVIGIFSLPILSSSGYVHFKHALEWNYFLGVIVFYLFTFLFWRKTDKPSVHTPEGV